MVGYMLLNHSRRKREKEHLKPLGVTKKLRKYIYKIFHIEGKNVEYIIHVSRLPKQVDI